MAIIQPNLPAGRHGRNDPRAAEGGMSQRRRWLLFGSNVVVTILLAAALTVAAVWLSGSLLRGRLRSDWTAGGRFSLSPQSRAMLAELPCDVRLTNLYSHTPQIPASEEQWQRVQDLLVEYQMASPRITVEAVNPAADVGGVESLVARLRQRYAKELEKPKAVLEQFAALRKDLSDLLETQAKRLDVAAAGWKGGPQDAVMALRVVAQGWRELKGVGDQTAAAIQILADQPLPAYATAIERAREYLKIVKDNLEAVPGYYAQVKESAQGVPMPDDVKAILAAGKETYEPTRRRIEAFDKAAADLPELELDAVRRDISQGMAILIETPDRVKVISFDEVWVNNPAPTGEGAGERLFNGESVLSSTLVGLSKPEKPAVLFVTFAAPAAAPGGPYAALAERLRKANFIVEDWDVLRQKEMPHPEHMTKAILVFVPPAASDRRQAVPPPVPEVYRAAIDVVRGGAPALVLAEPGGRLAPTVPYGELFELFGVKVRFDAVAVHKIVINATTDQEKALPQIEITSYADHPITRPLGGLPTMMLIASPLEAAKALPAGVTVQPLVELPGGPDYWADTVVFAAVRGEATRDDGADIPGPVPLAFAATRRLEKGEQKVVLFGNTAFAQDRVATYRDPFGQPMFPGNTELFLNSLLWVAGTEHLITVSPEAIQARRLGDVGAWRLPVQIILIGGLPVAVLAAGLVVYILRRR
jgi:hypothetical protein